MPKKNDRDRMTTDKASTLLDLAREKFGTLSEAEGKLFKAVANGERADFSAESEKDNDPAHADKWSGERVLKADRITWLCAEPQATALVTQRGIAVIGARIDGKLDLLFVRIPFPLFFIKSAFEGDINLNDAEIRALYLNGTHTGQIKADDLEVKGALFLRNGFKAEGEVRLVGATIGGNLDCEKGQFINPNRDALYADGLKVEGNVFLRNDFKAEGEVRLLGATIGGSLDCTKGNFINPEGNALAADRLKVEGGVFLSDDFKAEGEVRLLGATIGGNLECEKGQFINPNGIALHADGLKVEGGVFLRDDFKGEVRLVGATIGGDLDCEKGQFINPKGQALIADGSKVEGNVFLRNGFKAEGKVHLVGANIRRGLVWTNIKSPEKATLDLRLARIGTLWDDQKSWPGKGKLFLHGLDYDEIDDHAPIDAQSRIDWLRRQPTEHFSTQPYAKLASVLSTGGHDEGAKQVLIAKNKYIARRPDLRFFTKLKLRLLGFTVGYGYRPWRACWFVLAFVLLGWLLFEIGYRAGLMTPTKESAYIFDGIGESVQVSENYPIFNPLVYSLDTFVPLVDLHQASYWLPNANKEGVLFNIKVLRWFSSNALCYYMWFHIIMGWMLTTLLVVGLSGLIRS